ncbi:MAG TPA: PAS domain-containing protein [Candidatus Aquabacterium excrementipullorum]|nr:PAS domain-containing protein [Candidatus Aquabacterium excrementipullorum]
MRVNLPVSEHEYPFPAGETLVSTTDLKGRINYCNPAFIQVSGYTREELLGQPHNMIRHPDMPEEAFRDMWMTIASGQPWSALVKNRRKDGSYYWVKANVTPLMENDRPVGYMSVRTLPTRVEVQASERLYATMRAEKDAGRLLHKLEQGHVVRVDALGKLREGTRLGLVGQMMLISLLTAVLAYGVGVASAGGLSEINVLELLIGAVLMAGLGAAASLVIRALTLKPLEGLLVRANRMAAGDLTADIDSNRKDLVGKLAQSLNQLNVNLRSIVRDARNEVNQMMVATEEIASGNQDLSARTETQASNLQQTAASMEQITGTVRTSSDTAKQAASLAHETTAVTQRSSAAVDDVTQMMVAIEESSKRINEIIQVIDSIAFQTNILALNAAVEAARAGEQGRGFAVVASEVRALAQRTATAAKEVKQLITDSAEKISAGSRLTETAKTTMAVALQSVEKVGSLVEVISHGANEQLTGISQINSAIAQLDTITQQNAAAVEQISASSMALASRAQVVSATVQVFRIDAHQSHSMPDAVALRRNAKQQGTADHAEHPKLTPAPVSQPRAARTPALAANRAQPAMTHSPQPGAHAASRQAVTEGDWEAI